MIDRVALARRRRIVAAVVASVLVLGPLGWQWWTSLVPESYSVMDMGLVDTGEPQADGAGHGHGAVDGGTTGGVPTSVADLTGPAHGEPDVDVTLTAARGDVRLTDGRTVPGYTVNGTSPGPTIDATVGDLVQVTLVNASVPAGATLHWHGVDVPNAEDGVAGVTQDAVPVGGSFVYRFVVEDAGTFWYHSHQVSHEQVRGGLFGVLVVHPAVPDPDVTDVVAAVHTYGLATTVAGSPGELAVAAPAGTRLRVRVVNTGSGVLRVWVPALSWRVLAVDGRDVHEPGDVRDEAVVVPAGGRVDVGVDVPRDGSAVRVRIGAVSVVAGPVGATAPDAADPRTLVDLLAYGAPSDLGFEPVRPDREFRYAIGRRPGFVRGRPGLQWTVNGRTFPDVPMFEVALGDVVTMTVTNGSGQPHPMHLHGHHAVVLSRDGVAATGSPWWVDSLEVEPGDTYVIAFVADNPGIWLDHCHNLPHAAQGMTAHLVYTGVSEPYRVGAGNIPE